MTVQLQQLWCCGCNKDVEAHQTDGREIYPHRPDLFGKAFWKCLTCGNYVGCHWRSNTPTRPLGSIPTPAIRMLRVDLHNKMDHLWRHRRMNRGELYRRMSEKLGHQFHSGEIRNAEEARAAEKAISEIIVEEGWT